MQTMSLSKEFECDDPGCWYTYADVTLKLDTDNKPYIELTYTSSVNVPEEGDDVTEADGRKLFFKVK